MSATVTYTGDATFDDVHEPVSGKIEWGMDTLTRTMSGKQPLVATFVAGLSQGAAYSFGSNTYYLQTWESDNNPVYPRITLHYKGLVGGIPTPKASGQQITQSVSVTCSSPQAASRDITYVTRQSTTLYIASGRPTGSTYMLDITFTATNIYTLSSVIRTEDGAIYHGSAPAALVVALTPDTATQSFMQCTPVVGTPYFECSDTATFLYLSS